jgi:hypothetical protein
MVRLGVEARVRGHASRVKCVDLATRIFRGMQRSVYSTCMAVPAFRFSLSAQIKKTLSTSRFNVSLPNPMPRMVGKLIKKYVLWVPILHATF